MAEYKFKEKFRAEMVLGLIDRVENTDLHPNYPLHYYLDAARDFNDLDSASNFLKKECPICYEVYPVHEVSGLLYNYPAYTCAAVPVCP